MSLCSCKKIVVLQRGWIAVGDLAALDDEYFKLSNASIIRRWGTTKGLGELAQEGPKADTKLDPAGTLTFHKLAVVCAFDVESCKWS